MDFEGKVALVTGSSRGIGKAIIIELASRKCNVVINYVKSEKEANELKEQVINTYGVEAITVKCDVSNETEVKDMIKTIIKKFGKLDILVNNAGISLDNNFNDKTVEEFKRIMEVNLIGTFLVSKYASKHMLENSYGKIINITSTNGLDTYYPRGLDYDVSKAGVISLTHNLSKELSPVINVNAVACGWVNTDATKDMDDKFKEEEISKIYLRRFAYPSEIAKVVAFLASEEASYINNEVIRVDGGCQHV